MNQAQALYQLQRFDQDISQRKSRLADIEALLGENTRVQAAEQTLSQAEAALTPWHTTVTNLDLEIKSIAAKTESVEQRLYSGVVSNPKELQDMQEEIASLKRRRSNLEDDLLEAMIEVEHKQEDLDAARRNLEQITAEWEAGQHNLRMERAQLQDQLTQAVEQRAALKPDIAPEALERYKKLFRSKQGHVVAPLKDSNCQFCGVGQTTKTVQEVRQARALITCENCGRILVIL